MGDTGALVPLGSLSDSPDEESKERIFHFAIDKIAVNFELKMDRCFLEFEIGGQSIEDETEQVIQKPKVKKHKKPDGTVEEVEVMETVNLQTTRIKKTPVMRYISYQKRAIKAKSSDKFLHDRVDGYWYGSYSDLSKEYLTIRVWTSRLVGGNILVGEAKERFLDLADSKVDRSVHIRKRSGAAREETVCVVKLKCEFQEWFNFQIKFQNWELSYTKEEIESLRSIRESNMPCMCYSTKLDFQVHRSQEDLIDSLATMFCCFCRTDRQSLQVKDNLRTPAGKGQDAIAVVSYPGTRNWLEDEDLNIHWTKSIWCGIMCCSTSVASSLVPLQGTLDYGYISSPISVRRDACSCYSCRNGCYNSFMSSCNLLYTCFGPSCNCCRPGYSCYGTELSKEAKEKEKLMLIDERHDHFVDMTLSGVVTCDTMPRYRQQGSVDPVKRNGLMALTQTRDQATFLVIKVIRAKGLACIDEFKEMLNPSVSVEWSGIQKRTKVIQNSTNPYWDYDIYFKIPDKNGPPRKFEDFAESIQKSKLLLSVWDEDGLLRNSLGYVELDFRTIYEKREEKSIHIFSSDSKVQHLAYETKLSLDVPFMQVVEDKRSRENRKLIEAEHKYLEVMIYFDRIDNFSIDNRRIAAEKVEIPLAHLEKVRVQQFSRARALWDESLRYVEGKDRRFFAFFGKDEYTGDFHFLPTFLKPMHPPANMKDLAEIFYYVFSMEVQQKPAVEADDARRKRALKLKDPCSPIVHNDVWVWTDPYFFFEKKKGDLKDHCILLCNFLLGLGLPKDQFNAFICIGTTRSKKIVKPTPHVWVMTQEMFPHQKKPIIRFWELKTGETIALEGPRFSAVYQHDPQRAMKKKSDFAVINPSSLPTEEEGVTGGGGAEPKKDMSWDKVGRRMNENLAEFDYNDDAALLDLTNNPSLSVESSSNTDLVNVIVPSSPSYGKNGGLLATQNMNTTTTASVYSSASVAEVENEREFVQHRLALLQEFIREQEERFPNPKDNFWDEGKKKQTPYASIDVIFNHECLFGNLQQANPEVIMYDLMKEKRWIEFSQPNWQECFGYQALAPFFKNKAIVSVLAPERDIEVLKFDTIQRLKDSLITHRSYQHKFETIFFDKFEFTGTVVGLESVQDYAKERLEIETLYGMRDESLRALDNERNKTLGTPAENETDADFNLNKAIQKIRSKVIRNLKDGVEFQERLFHFKHTDANRIGDQIRTQCYDLLAFPDTVQPRFQLFIDIERLPGQICPVRVLMMIMYSK